MTADKVKVRCKGFAFTATAGTTTSGDYKFTEARLLDGTQLILKGHSIGDNVKFQIVDVDNILGLGAGTVLDEFANNWYMIEDRQDQGKTRFAYSAEILAGLYIRLNYTSVGTSNVSVYCNLFAHAYSG
jgi:hypothetical protein